MTLIHRNKNPYKSTNIYRVTASLTPDFPTLTPFEKIEKARRIIFTFDYPTPDNIDSQTFKDYFETMFISRFWENFFSAETYESFSVRFYSKMLEVMPTYAHILSLFFNNNIDDLILNITESTTKTNSNTDTTNKGNDVITTNKSGSINNENKNINSNFPANMMSAGTKINNVDYANNGGITNDKQTSSENGTQNNKIDNTSNQKNNSETTVLSHSGSKLDGYIKYNNEFKSIFTNLLNEFKPLFSAVLDL